MRRKETGSRTLVTLLVLVLTLALMVGCTSLVGTEKAEANSGLTVSQKLAEVRVRPAGTMEGYSREKFPHWSDAQKYGWKLPAGTPDPESCDVREAALIRDGRDERVQQYCDVVSGRWLDPYGGKTYTNPSDIDIDHIVPLANAWRSGASSWTTAKRESFANIARDLLSVDDGLNQSKGDKGPEAWKPPR
jgi:hypothetical protein